VLSPDSPSSCAARKLASGKADCIAPRSAGFLPKPDTQSLEQIRKSDINHGLFVPNKIAPRSPERLNRGEAVTLRGLQTPRLAYN